MNFKFVERSPNLITFWSNNIFFAWTDYWLLTEWMDKCVLVYWTKLYTVVSVLHWLSTRLRMYVLRLRFMCGGYARKKQKVEPQRRHKRREKKKTTFKMAAQCYIELVSWVWVGCVPLMFAWLIAVLWYHFIEYDFPSQLLQLASIKCWSFGFTGWNYTKIEGIFRNNLLFCRFSPYQLFQMAFHIYHWFNFFRSLFWFSGTWQVKII